MTGPARSVRARLAWQFSLRGFLVAVLCLSVAIAYWTDRVKKRRAAIEGILRLGGEITYDCDADYLAMVGYQAHHSALNPLWRGLGKAAVQDVVIIGFPNTDHTPEDADLVLFPYLSEARALCLQSRPKLGDYQWCRITDSGLKHLRNFKRLEVLHMMGAPLTDRGVDELVRFKKLRQLDISESRITDAGFLRLSRLSDLEYIGVAGSDVTRAGVDEFQRRLPRCDVIWGGSGGASRFAEALATRQAKARGGSSATQGVAAASATSAP